MLGTVFIAPRLDAGLFIALIVRSLSILSLVFDHFGVTGFDVHEASYGRMLGAALMIAGVARIAST